MNTYFIKRFIARTAVVLSAAALFCGCSDDDETSTLHFDKPEVVIGPESSTASFILRSDTSWKLHSDADWFTLNLTKGAKSASVSRFRPTVRLAGASLSGIQAYSSSR